MESTADYPPPTPRNESTEELCCILYVLCTEYNRHSASTNGKINQLHVAPSTEPGKATEKRIQGRPDSNSTSDLELDLALESDKPEFAELHDPPSTAEADVDLDIPILVTE
jgi:hypothetical protein